MKRTLSHSYFFSIMGVAWAATLVIGIAWIGLEYIEFQREALEDRQERISTRREMVISVVDDAVHYINYQRDRFQEELRQRLKARMQDAVLMAEHVLENAAGQEEAQTRIIELLRTIRYDGGRGYFNIFDGHNIPLLLPYAQGEENRPLPDGMPEREKLFQALDSARESGSTAVEQICSHPFRPGEPALRSCYLEYVQELDWVIVTGEFMSDAEEELKEHIISWLEQVSFKNGGYIFIGRYDGLSLTNPQRGKNLYDMQDMNGTFVVRELIRIARNGGGFVHYLLPPIQGMPPADKMSFVRGVQDWEWYVGAGLYMDDIDIVVRQKQEAMLLEVRRLAVVVLVCLLLITAASYLITRSLASVLHRNIESFLEFFNKGAEESVTLDPESLSFVEFERLAGSANIMIRERNRAEETLNLSRQHFEALFNKSFELAILTDIRNTPLQINQTALDFYGCELTDLQGAPLKDTPWWKAADEAGRETMHHAGEQALGGTTVRYELDQTLDDGSTHHFDIALSPLKDDQDAVVQLLMECRDITELKNAEAAMRQLHILLACIMDAMPSMIVTIDSDARISLLNAEAERVVGLSHHAAQGRHYLDILNVVEGIEEIVETARKGSSSVVHDRIPWKRGDRMALAQVTVSPLSWDGGGGAVIRLDDITERISMEEVVIQTEKMASLGGLAAGMAHEINNPLAAIIGNLQSAQRRLLHDTPKNREVALSAEVELEAVGRYVVERGVNAMLDAGLESARRAARIVSNMLSFSRKDNSGMLSCDIVDLWTRAMDLAFKDYDLGHEFNIKAVEVITEPSPDAITVPCEPNQIQQVFLNLIKNGVQAMAGNPKDRPPTFTFRTHRTSDSIEISISDNGPGMSPELRKRIMEPFFTTKDPGAGTGLGLSVSYFIIATNHGGRMYVLSTPDKGTTFIISLPLTPPKRP